MRAWPLLFLPLFALACSKAEPARAGASHATTVEAAKPSVSKAMLEIRGRIEVDVDDARKLAASLDAHAREVGGFVEQSNLDGGSATLTLRVPSSDLPALRAMLGGQGVIAHESLTAKDVTDAIADVDARVRSAKTEETRLLLLLEKQTGTLADVLAVERSLADVRERVERLEAEQRGAHGRVDLATIEIVLRVRGSAEDAPFAHRLAVAGREGVAFAREAAILATTTAVRVTPTLGPLALAAFALARFTRRKKSA
jgi:hypothetical protein